MDWTTLQKNDSYASQSNSDLVSRVVNEFMSQGKFDQLRRRCTAEMDTKPAYKDLKQKVDMTIQKFLRKQCWRPEINKNQLRDNLKRHVMGSRFLNPGVERLVDQIITPQFLEQEVRPTVQEFVENFLGIKREPTPMDTEDDLVVCDSPKMERVFEEVVVPGEESWLPVYEPPVEDKKPEINLKEVTETEPTSDNESEVSITNQMSPLSVAGNSPKNDVEMSHVSEMEAEKMESETTEKKSDNNPIPEEKLSQEDCKLDAMVGSKKPSQFIGKIPKKRKDEDSKQVKKESENDKNKEKERHRSRDKDKHRSSSSSRKDRHRDRSRHRSRDRHHTTRKKDDRRKEDKKDHRRRESRETGKKDKRDDRRKERHEDEKKEKEGKESVRKETSDKKDSAKEEKNDGEKKIKEEKRHDDKKRKSITEDKKAYTNEKEEKMDVMKNIEEKDDKNKNDIEPSKMPTDQLPAARRSSRTTFSTYRR